VKLVFHLLVSGYLATESQAVAESGSVTLISYHYRHRLSRRARWLSGPFSSRLPLAIYCQERGDRRWNQANLSALRVPCSEIQSSYGKLNDPEMIVGDLVFRQPCRLGPSAK